MVQESLPSDFPWPLLDSLPLGVCIAVFQLSGSPPAGMVHDRRMILYSRCKATTWRRCSVNVSLKETPTELGDISDSHEQCSMLSTEVQQGLHAS